MRRPGGEQDVAAACGAAIACQCLGVAVHCSMLALSRFLFALIGRRLHIKTGTRCEFANTCPQASGHCFLTKHVVAFCPKTRHRSLASPPPMDAIGHIVDIRYQQAGAFQ